MAPAPPGRPTSSPRRRASSRRWSASPSTGALIAGVETPIVTYFPELKKDRDDEAADHDRKSVDHGRVSRRRAIVTTAPGCRAATGCSTRSTAAVQRARHTMEHSTGNTHLLSAILTKACEPARGSSPTTRSPRRSDSRWPDGPRIRKASTSAATTCCSRRVRCWRSASCIAIGRANGRQVVPEPWIDPLVRAARPLLLLIGTRAGGGFVSWAASRVLRLGIRRSAHLRRTGSRTSGGHHILVNSRRRSAQSSAKCVRHGRIPDRRARVGNGNELMQLLVSVTDAIEAAAALDGGADIIDAKDPASGALGAVTVDVFRDIHACSLAGCVWSRLRSAMPSMRHPPRR